MLHQQDNPLRFSQKKAAHFLRRIFFHMFCLQRSLFRKYFFYKHQFNFKTVHKRQRTSSHVTETVQLLDLPLFVLSLFVEIKKIALLFWTRRVIHMIIRQNYGGMCNQVVARGHYSAMRRSQHIHWTGHYSVMRRSQHIHWLRFRELN